MKRQIHDNAKDFIEQTNQSYDLHGDQKPVFDATVDHLSNYWRASDQLGIEGLTIKQDNGMVRKHPCVEIMKTSWAGFLAGLRLLCLCGPDEMPKKRPGRPDGG